MRAFSKILSVAAFAAFASNASAIVHNLTASLDGLQEVPPNASPASGNCNITLDDISGAMSVNCTFAGLIGGPATVAHVHGLAPAGMNAGVIFGLTVTNATSGTVTGNGVLTAAQIAGALSTGPGDPPLTYVNIHNAQFPGGEIRGQIVPEPASLSLLVVGGLALLRRRAA